MRIYKGTTHDNKTYNLLLPFLVQQPSNSSPSPSINLFTYCLSNQTNYRTLSISHPATITTFLLPYPAGNTAPLNPHPATHTALSIPILATSTTPLLKQKQTLLSQFCQLGH